MSNVRKVFRTDSQFEQDSLTDMEKITTNKGKPGLLIEGYEFRMDKENKTSHRWRCVKRSCGARCKTDLQDLMILDARADHNHEPDEERKIQRQKLRQECKKGRKRTLLKDRIKSLSQRLAKWKIVLVIDFYQLMSLLSDNQFTEVGERHNLSCLSHGRKHTNL